MILEAFGNGLNVKYAYITENTIMKLIMTKARR